LLRVPDRFAAGIRSIPGCALGGNRLAGCVRAPRFAD